MQIARFFLLFALVLMTGCSRSRECGRDEAMNKAMALGKIESRVASKGGETGGQVALSLAMEAAPVHELIAQEKYVEACAKADELAKRLGVDLDAIQKDMLTVEQLAKDGGRGSGTCSIADAAKKQMEVHALLQKEVDAGRKSPDVFREFNEDTRSYGDLLTSNPSEACALLDRVKAKHGL